MPTSEILLFSEDNTEVARISFRYQKDIYHGTTKVSGTLAKDVTATFKDKPSVYVPDMGGPSAGPSGGPFAWSWLVAVAGYMIRGKNRLAASMKIIHPPKRALFRSSEVPPGVIP